MRWRARSKQNPDRLLRASNSHWRRQCCWIKICRRRCERRSMCKKYLHSRVNRIQNGGRCSLQRGRATRAETRARPRPMPRKLTTRAMLYQRSGATTRTQVICVARTFSCIGSNLPMYAEASNQKQSSQTKEKPIMMFPSTLLFGSGSDVGGGSAGGGRRKPAKKTTKKKPASKKKK